VNFDMQKQLATDRRVSGTDSHVSVAQKWAGFNDHYSKMSNTIARIAHI